MKKQIIFLLLLASFFITCEKRDWINPFDPACPKEMWTPTNFSAVQVGSTVKLTWSQPMDNISGFKLTKKIDTGSATDLQSQAKTSSQFVDATLTGGKLHTYSIVAFAGNNQSNIVTVTVTPTLAAGVTVTDLDGNVYSTVMISTQVWMGSNLKTTKYKDGTAIPLVTDATAWANLSTPAYCWYNNDATTYKNTYGALYIWYSLDLKNGSKYLCPTGWHVPSDQEWTILITYLGGESLASGKLKEIGTNHWLSTDVDATNETGFTAIPGGERGVNGKFTSIGYTGNWWSSTEYSSKFARYWSMYTGKGNVGSSSRSKQSGFSVRCVKD